MSTQDTSTNTELDFQPVQPPEFGTAGFGFIRNIVRAVTKIVGGGDSPPPQSTPSNNPPVRLLNLEMESSLIDGFSVSLQLPDNVFGDPEGQTITYSMSNLPPGLSFNASTRVISGTPTQPFNGVVTLTGTDPHGASATETFKMLVVSNNPPVSNLDLAPEQMIVGKDYEFAFDRDSFTDPEGRSVSYKVSGLPTGMTVNSETWKIEGRPSEAGTFTVTVTATDPQGNSANDTFTMIVVPNQAPQLVGSGIPDVSRNVNQIIDIDLKRFFNDPDAQSGDVISISTSTLPEGLRVENGRLVGSTEVAGTFNVKVYARDGGASADPVTFTLTIVQPNRAPEIGQRLTSQTVEANETVTIPISEASFTDADNDTLTLTARGLPQGLTLRSKTSGGHEIVGSTSVTGQHRIVITARDPSGTSAEQSFRLSVDDPEPDFPDDDSPPPINGTSQANIIFGTSRNDTINGLAGNDYLYGRGGDDTLNGGANNDRIYGGEGRDTLNGDSGNDFLYFDALDTVDGGTGTDVAIWHGTGGMNAITVNSRSYVADENQQRLVSVEKVQGGRQRDIIRDKTNSGVEFYGGEGNDDLHGGGGRDYLQGNSGNDRLYGGAGHDTLRGNDDNDQLYGGQGNDALYGEGDNDRLFGEGGNDRLYGGDGSDRLEGGANNDRLFGNAGADILLGGTGKDILYIDQFDTVIDGGSGDDAVVWRGSVGANLAIVSSSSTRVSSGQQKLIGIEAVVGGNRADVIRDYSNAGIEISGNGGADQLYGGTGNDKLFGDDGNDRLYGGRGEDRLYGGDNADRLDGGDGSDLLSGQAGNDTLIGGAGRDILFGGSGADTFVLQSDRNIRETDIVRDFQRGSDKIKISGLSSIKVQRIDTNQDGQSDAVALWSGDPRAPTFYGIVMNLTELSATDFQQEDGSAFTSVDVL